MAKQGSKAAKPVKKNKTVTATRESSNRQTPLSNDLPGVQLLRAIDQRATTLGLYAKDVAEMIHLYPVELSRLRKGHLDVRNLSRERLERIADFLEIPLLAAMLLAEQVRPADFYRKDGEGVSNIKDRISRACRFILDDPEWGAVTPKALMEESTPDEWRLFMVWCYEKATNTVLIEGAADYISYIEEKKG